MLVKHTLLFNGFHIMGSPMRLPFAWWILCWTALEGCHMNLQPILSLHVDVGWTLDSDVFPKGSWHHWSLAWWGWGCDLRALCRFWAAVSDEGPECQKSNFLIYIFSLRPNDVWNQILRTFNEVTQLKILMFRASKQQKTWSTSSKHFKLKLYLIKMTKWWRFRWRHWPDYPHVKNSVFC